MGKNLFSMGSVPKYHSVFTTTKSAQIGGGLEGKTSTSTFRYEKICLAYPYFWRYKQEEYYENYLAKSE